MMIISGNPAVGVGGGEVEERRNGPFLFIVFCDCCAVNNVLCDEIAVIRNSECLLNVRNHLFIIGGKSIACFSPI